MIGKKIKTKKKLSNVHEGMVQTRLYNLLTETIKSKEMHLCRANTQRYHSFTPYASRLKETSLFILIKRSQ